MISRFFKSYWRNIRKHPGFSILNITGLSIGLTSSMLLLLYVKYHLDFDKQISEADRIYFVYNNQKGDDKIFTFGATPYQIAPAIKGTVPGVEEVVRVEPFQGAGQLSYGKNSFRKTGVFVDPSIFKMFKYHFIQGNPSQALGNINSIVITQDLASTLFGRENPVGKLVKRNNLESLVVTGVIENVPPNSTLQFDYLLNLSLFINENPGFKQAGWGSNFLKTYVKLKDQNQFPAANSVVKKMLKAHQEGYSGEAFLFPLLKLHLYDKFENGLPVGGLVDQINLLFILAMVILLIACVNFMNLSTARSEERAKEVGIRKSLGSRKASLIGQFISESLLLSFIATLLAIICLIITMPFFDSLLSLQLKIPYKTGSFYVFVFFLWLVTGVVSGSYPAFYLSSFNPVKVLKGTLKGSDNVLPVRQILVVVQFGFAAFLIIATLVIFRQLNYIRQLPVGYNRGGIVEVPVEGSLGKKLPVFLSSLQEKRAIIASCPLSQSITQNGSNTWGYEWPKKRPNEKVLIDILSAGFDFCKTTGVTLKEGRDFQPSHPSDTSYKNVIVNETAVNLMRLKSPLGTILRNGENSYTIIGVIKDFVWGSPYSKAAPMVIDYCSANSRRVLALKLSPSESATRSISQIQEELKKVNPAFNPQINFVDQDFEHKFASEKLLASLSNLFGGLAIAISSLGLLGLAAYAAEKRNKEIGIRKVLGAATWQIMEMLTKDFIRLVVIANLIAIPLAYYSMHLWLQKFDFKTTLSWWIFASVILITVVIAFVTVGFQAYRAAIVNPIKSIRSE